jgi:hypothetical protein
VVKCCRLSILTASEEQYNARTAETCLGTTCTVLFLELGYHSRYMYLKHCAATQICSLAVRNSFSINSLLSVDVRKRLNDEVHVWRLERRLGAWLGRNNARTL